MLNLAVCSNPGPAQKKARSKRKNESLSLSATLCAAIVKHQLGELFKYQCYINHKSPDADGELTGLSINCILLLTLTHLFFPSLRPRTAHYFNLSYRDHATGLYYQGWNDMKFVSFWIVIFTALRAAAMDYVLVPLAKSLGITKKKTTIRFAEQAWLLVYYAVFWTLGMVNSSPARELPTCCHFADV